MEVPKTYVCFSQLYGWMYPAYVREGVSPPPTTAVNEVQETLHFLVPESFGD